MPLDQLVEVHVNDIGTLYRARLYDDALPFDPTDAAITELIFKMPGGLVLTKTATIVPGGGSPVTEWFLTYTVTAGAGGGSPATEFHAAPGPVKMQVFLEWPDGTKYHSDIRTTDDQGRELRVYANLD